MKKSKNDKSRTCKSKITGTLLILLASMALPFSSIADKYSGSSKIKCTKVGVFKNGHCIEVDNHLLYVESFGLPTASNVPNIIFLPGSGNTLNIWDQVAPEVAKFAHVVTYDRSGYGLSQQYSKPRPLTAPLIVTNLVELLQKIHVSPPYILVGHSHGGLFAQYFALKEPSLVRGMVLVDSSTTQLVMWPRFHHYLPDDKVKSSDPFYYEALGITPTLEAVKKSMSEKGLYPFENLSIAVLTSNNHKDLNYFTQEMEEAWQSFQHQLTKTSRKSYQIIAYNSGHFIQVYQPKLVIDAIYTMATTKYPDKF